MPIDFYVALCLIIISISLGNLLLMNVLDGEPIKIKLLVKLLYQDFTQQTVSDAAHDQGQRWKKARMHRRCKMNLKMIDTKVD